MSTTMIGVTGIVFLIVLMLLRFPIGLAMLLVGSVGYAILESADLALVQLGMSTFKYAVNYTLSVIPLFTLMGLFLTYSGTSEDLYEAVNTWFGKVRGSLAITTIGASAIFASISGTAFSTAATLGRIGIPEMKRYNYDEALASGSVAVGSTLGIMIPPSVSFILYGVITMEPIGDLFIAGFVPGILTALLFMILINIRVRINPELAPISQSEEIGMAEKMKSLKKIWPFVVIFSVSIGGIYLGFFTPTEAGAFGAFGAFVISLMSGKMDFKKLYSSLEESARITAMIFIMLLGANMFSNFLTVSRLPMNIMSYVNGLEVSRYVILAAILVIYFIMGMFIESISISVLTLPIVYPIIKGLGFNGIWFAVVFVLMIQMALITPPLGLVVYVVHGVDPDIPMETVFKGIIPFLSVMILLVISLILFPDIALFLPNLMKG